MTKEEVLQGAVALNDENTKYVVTVEDSKIIIQSKRSSDGTPSRSETFRCIAHLNDDHTYVEVHVDGSGRPFLGGKAVKVSKTVSLSYNRENDTIGVQKEEFNSEDMTRVLRNYLQSCGYKKTNRGFFKKLWGR